MTFFIYKNMNPGLFYSIYNHGLKHVSKRFNFGHKKCSGLILLKNIQGFYSNTLIRHNWNA